MPEAVEVLRRMRASGVVDEGGRKITLDFAPPLTADETDALRNEVGVPLPAELVAVLGETSAVEGVEQLDFTGRTMDVMVEEVAPAGLPFAADGFGNFWLLDLTPEPTATAPVFFLCHDPPVFAYQGASLGGFLEELSAMYEPGRPSTVRDVHDTSVFEIWRSNPSVVRRDTALAADAELTAFARRLDERFELVDLRRPEVGAGFSWGRYGPRTEIRRHGYARIFACGPPEQRPSFFRRLRGR
jgi:hypothetical protein